VCSLAKSFNSDSLSEARDLIKNILEKDPSNRLTIPQILSHAWFNSRPTSANKGAVAESTFLRPVPATQTPSPPSSPSLDSRRLSALSDSDLLFSEPNTVMTSNPDNISSRGNANTVDGSVIHHRNTNEHTPQGLPRVSEEQDDLSTPGRPETSRSSSSSKVPPHPTRTPARTKRRSVSSALSDPDYEPDLTSLSDAQSPSPIPQDFSSLLNTPAPIIFSTPLERELLNHLSTLGFDTGQIVHSVLSDACDAAGAVWWMLRRKAEKRAAEGGGAPTSGKLDEELRRVVEAERGKRGKKAIAVQTDTLEHGHSLSIARSAPQLAFVPPTPTAASAQRPTTPPSSERRLLSPSPTPAERSQPSTPSGSFKDREYQGSKGRKPRAGSVSIMQRATTALEAAGLVRKKSTEAVRTSDEIAARERERSKENERQSRAFSLSDEPRSSYGSGSSKLTKSPPPKATRDMGGTPTTPPTDNGEPHHSQPLMGSPWVLAGSGASPPPHATHSTTPVSSPGDTLSSLPNFQGKSGKPSGGHRSRASLLSAFRFWFNEDRKGKRKETAPPVSRSLPPGSAGTSGTVKRRTSNKGTGKFASRKKQSRTHRHSISSRRSSSVNSRRSSGTSAQVLLLDSPIGVYDHVPRRRSFGSHTPNSERDHSSRPSSVRSFQRHRKSPSASSIGSAQPRSASPVQKYHRRVSSSTSTRVVRQTTPNQTSSTRHVRSNSATSSIHSLPSSRPASWYDPSETEMQRTNSPFKAQNRRSLDDSTPRKSGHGNSSTTFVAQKKQTPFMSPSGYTYNASAGRSSWKKSWGLEPPGWQSRTTHLPVEVLAISPADGSGIRDVFSGRTNLTLGMGDESDWVDEDDDPPTFAGGLGQTPTSASGIGHVIHEAPPVTLAPAPRGPTPARNSKRGRATGTVSTTYGRQKASHSPTERTSPIPGDGGIKLDLPETRGGRRQLPPARSGPAFRGHAIQEEDEGEEE
jgi:hypothetical protein